MTLPRDFYDRPTLDVAADLIGKVLVHNRRGVRTSGIIVEVEAYIGESDPACHAAPGPTARNEPLYGPPGYAYVYLNYGIHCLVNVVTEAEGSPAAVLIRALEPLEGLSLMEVRRRTTRVLDLCRGPGRLCQALAIDRDLDGADLMRSRDLWLAAPAARAAIGASRRIGISKAFSRRLRFYERGNPFVSGPKRLSS